MLTSSLIGSFSGPSIPTKVPVFCGEAPQAVRINFANFSKDVDLIQYLFRNKPEWKQENKTPHLYCVTADGQLLPVVDPAAELSRFKEDNKYWILFKEDQYHPKLLQELLQRRSQQPVLPQGMDQQELSKTEELQNQLNRESARRQELQTSIQQLEKQVQQRHTEASEIKQTLESKIKHLTAQLEETEAELKSLRENYEKLEKAHDEETKQHARFRELEKQRVDQQKQELELIHRRMEDVYDIIIKIRTPRSIEQGWFVDINKKLIPDDEDGKTPINVLNSLQWKGTVVSVVGGFDKGKSMLLNKLVDGSFPSSCRVHTVGLSFKQLAYKERNYILVDSAGKDSAFRMEPGSDLSVNDSEAEDRFTSDVVFEISDIFIFVVNEISGKEQREIHRLTKRLRESNKRFRDLFVVVNLKHAQTLHEFEDLMNQHISYYPEGQLHSHPVTINGLGEKYVSYFSGPDMHQRHFFMAHEDSEAGKQVNAWTYDFIRTSLSIAVVASQVPAFSAIRHVEQSITKLLPVYTTVTDARVQLVSSTDPKQGKAMFTLVNPPQNPIIPRSRNVDFSMAISSDAILTENTPIYDARRLEDKFVFFIEAPGADIGTIHVRADVVNSMVNIKYKVADPNSSGIVEKVKSQRRYGDFSLQLRVPPEFYCESKYRSVSFDEGVIQISFEQKQEEEGPSHVIRGGATPK